MKTRDDISAAIARYYETLRSGDPSAFAAALADDVAIVYHGPKGLLPWVGSWHGYDGFRAFRERVTGALEIVAIEPQDTLIDGDKAVVFIRGTWRGRATGKTVVAEAANVFTITDGRVSRYEVYTDTASIAAAIGV